MAAFSGTREIEELGTGLRMEKKVGSNWMSKQGRVYSIENDINQLFKAIEVKTSIGGDVPRRNPMKKPARASSSRPSGIGISESVNLKQALRGLCISQASEMAAMKRRLLKPPGISGMSDMGATKRLYRAVIAEADESGLPLNEVKGNLVELMLPTEIIPNLSKEIPESVEVALPSSPNQSSHSTLFVEEIASKTKMMRAPSRDKIVPLPSESGDELSDKKIEERENLKMKESLRSLCTIQKVLEEDDIVPARRDALIKSIEQKKQKDNLHSASFPSSSVMASNANKSSNSPRLMYPVFRTKSFLQRKAKLDSTLASHASSLSRGNIDADLCSRNMVCHTGKIASKGESKASDKTASILGSVHARVDFSSSASDSSVSQVVGSKASNVVTPIVAKTGDRSRSREKGEISKCSKSSIGEHSSSTSISGESSLSGSNRCGNRPHIAKDLRWEAVQRIQGQHGSLGLRHFKLLRKLGSGDIGTVYLAELVNTNCLFALKVMDNEFLSWRKKFPRAQTEREILQMLDHPFLPTLYAHFTTDKFSCLVMEYCPGGDLHSLRQKQPNRSFPEQAARFYVAEILLALEYLHLLGVVYRDLKPENILVREDGHIMLSDFDLSLRCVVSPTLFRSSSPVVEPVKKVTSPCSESSCMDPFCLKSSWQVPCFTPRLLTTAAKTRKLKPDQAAQVNPLPQLVVEPTDARSNSFVGTHEYLAPEIVKGEGHGSAVDWWTYGIFLYELIYGKTPFKGSSNEETLSNVVSQRLKFPASPIVSFHAKDLIRGLLIKEAENRLGFVKGAAEIKQHPFFDGLNWALIRCAVPPERPTVCDIGQGRAPTMVSSKEGDSKSPECKGSEHIKFELF
ncbi:hypothetical protein Ancab_007598 [Ancistrocladus abbreviatus]